MELTSSTILITGGGSGLGLATARRLVAAGARVCIADLAPPSGDVEALDGTTVFVETDITDDDDVTRALDVAESAFGPVRGLVHTAGRGGDRLRILGPDGGASPMASFEDVLRVNLLGTYNVLRLTAARMATNAPVDGERGSVVLTASVAAFDGQIGQTAYTASKAAVHGITLVAARDLASRGVRVNTIAPGVFETPMLGRLRADIRTDLAGSVPFPRRLGSADEYAHLAAALLENGYVNGETVRLDGAIRMPPR